MGGGAGGDWFQGTRGGRYLGRRQKGKMPMNNQTQNDQFRAVVTKLKLNKEQARELHFDTRDMGFGYQEMLEHAKNMFGK